MPRSLASRCSRAAASRTCETDAGRRAELLAPERLHRVDHADVGRLGGDRRADRLEARLGEHADALDGTEPLGAQAHLRGRLLTGDQQHLRAPGEASRAARRSGSTCRCPARRRAARASRARARRRARDRARRCPVRRRFACSSGTSASGTTRPASPGAAARPGRARLRRALLDERRPGLTAGAASEPARLAASALTADEDGLRGGGPWTGQPTGEAGRRRARRGSAVAGRRYGEVQVRVLDGVQRGLGRDLTRLQLAVGTDDLEVEPTRDVVPDQPNLSAVGGRSGFEFTLHAYRCTTVRHRLVGVV